MQTKDSALQSLLLRKLNVDFKTSPHYRVEVDKLQYLPGVEIGGFEGTIMRPEKSTSSQAMITARLVELSPNNISTADCNSPAVICAGYSSNVDIPQSRGFITGSDPHRGIDFAVNQGTKIFSPWDGTVHTVAHQSGYGLMMIIKHGGPHDIYTLYGHLHSVQVNVGDKVSKEQHIAYSGGDPDADPSNAGSSDGAHLHFEIRTPGSNYNGNPNNPVDPMPYLNGLSCGFPGVPTNNQHSSVLASEEFSGYLNRTYHQKFAVNPLTPGNNNGLQSKGWRYSVKPVTKGQTSTGYMFAGLSDVGTATLSLLRKLNNNAIITFSLSTEGFLNGDSFEVRADSKTIYGPSIQGTNGKNVLIEVAAPAGIDRLDFIFTNSGGHNAICSIGQILIDEVSGDINTSVDTSHHTVETFESTFLTPTFKKPDKHRFGVFNVAETMVLDNIMDITISEQYDQSTQELVITVANPNGYYSPDYDPSMFPELRLPPSPWVYTMDGQKVGILSENTPIRVWLGYGDRLQRMFTGKIGRVVANSASNTLTIVAYGMYKVLMNRTILFDLYYPEASEPSKAFVWLKSSIAQDLVTKAGLTNYVVQASLYRSDKPLQEQFYMLDENNKPQIENGSDHSQQSPYGYIAPYCAPPGTHFNRGTTYEDALYQLFKDTDYRSYCDREGVYRLERISYSNVISSIFTQDENLISVSKTIDHSRSRAHLQLVSSDGNTYDAYDDDLLIALKGELRTVGHQLDFPISGTQTDVFKTVAQRYFLDMKRISRTLNAVVLGDPSLDLLDRVLVVDKSTTTRNEYIIKGIKHVLNKDGYLCYLELTWDD